MWLLPALLLPLLQDNCCCCHRCIKLKLPQQESWWSWHPLHALHPEAQARSPATGKSPKRHLEDNTSVEAHKPGHESARPSLNCPILTVSAGTISNMQCLHRHTGFLLCRLTVATAAASGWQCSNKANFGEVRSRGLSVNGKWTTICGMVHGCCIAVWYPPCTPGAAVAHCSCLQMLLTPH